MLPILTAYDPIGGSAGSIDPLGALQAYVSLADLLLPGVTTITNRSRYLSMLSAALANVEEHRKLPAGASGLAQRRQAVEPFERLWALACVAARESDPGAADGLRGVTRAEKAYRDFANSGKRVNCDFRLLKYQSRTGGIATYWTTLVGGDLVDGDTGALTVDGKELAGQFPAPPLENKEVERLADLDSARRVSLTIEDLEDWGKACHLKAARQGERQQLAEALTADDRRECVASALQRMGGEIPQVWDLTHLRILRKELEATPKVAELGLPTVIEAIDVTEQCHEALLTVFETLLWWGTMNAGKPVADLIGSAEFSEAVDRCRETAGSFRQFREECERHEVRNAIESWRGFCLQVEHCKSERDLVAELLNQHHEVQSGKMDGAVPKRDWIGWDGSALLRPSPRFQRMEPPPAANRISLTHPYRLEPFISMLRENGRLCMN